MFTAPQNLSPETLAAFLGQSPLLSAQPHFPSRADLLQSYANYQSHIFSPEAANAAHCEICQAAPPHHAFLTLTWSARIRWHPKRIALLLLLSPLLFAAVACHIEFLATDLLNRIHIQDRIDFQTVHPLCKTCRRKLRLRAFLYNGWQFIVLFTIGIAFLISVVAASLVTVSLLQIWNFRPKDANESLLVLAFAGAICLALSFLNRHLSPKIRLPKPLRRLIKRPFRQST